MTTEKATPPGIALDNEALDKLEALARAATQGEWQAQRHGVIVAGPMRTYANGSAQAQIASFNGTFHDDDAADEPDRKQANAEFSARANPVTILALIAQARASQPQPSAAPDGWQWAPIEPTEAMVHAGEDVPAPRPFGKVYRAMLAAAPSPNFAARGAEPAIWTAIARLERTDSTQEERIAAADDLRKAASGMQEDTNEATPNTCYKGWTVENLYREVKRLSAQLSAARQGQGMRPLSDGLPSPDEHDRVLIYTEGSDFAGEQYFDIKTDELRECDPEARKEVVEFATHWMPHPTAAPTPHEQETRAAVMNFPALPEGAYAGDFPAEAIVYTDDEVIAFGGKAQAMAVKFRSAAQAGMLPVAQTDAARDVLAERRRQIEQEGWTPAHDDEHAQSQMAQAAACYAAQGDLHFPENWPWSMTWWKPQGERRNLVKAGALILAEIERLDRATVAADPKGGAA